MRDLLKGLAIIWCTRRHLGGVKTPDRNTVSDIAAAGSVFAAAFKAAG